MLDCGDEAASWISRYILDKESGLRIGFHNENFKNRLLDKQKYRFYPELTNKDMVMRYLIINNHFKTTKAVMELDKAFTFRFETDFEYKKLGFKLSFVKKNSFDVCRYITHYLNNNNFRTLQAVTEVDITCIFHFETDFK